jgi:hypothetical protein
VAQLHPPALGSLFVAPYASRGGRIENTASHGSSIVACAFTATKTCLQSRSIAMAVSSGSDISLFRRHVTIYMIYLTTLSVVRIINCQ